MIELKNIEIKYDTLIVSIDSLKFHLGKIHGIFGESGSGKTSILNTLFGDFEIKEGQYLVGDESINDVSAFARNHISYILQNPIFLDDLTCWKNIEVQLSISNSKLKVDDLLALVHLDIDSKIYPQMLSGGQKQKLALAVALAKNSEIILCDEITASLDKESSHEIIELLKNLSHSLNKCIILSSHDAFVKQNCDIIYQIENKKIKALKESDVNQSTLKIENTTKKLKLFTKYTLFIGTLKKYKMKNILKLFLLGITASLVVIGVHAASQYTNHFKLYHNFLNRNISYVHHSDKLNLYLPDSEPFSQEDEDYLINYSGIKKVYPYIPLERRSNINEISAYLKNEPNTNLDYSDGKLTSINKKAYDFTLKMSGLEKKYEDPRSNLEGATVNNFLAPYYEEMDLESKCISYLNKEGIYITYDLAQLLDIQKLEQDMTLSYTVSVPVSRISIQAENNSIRNMVYKNVEIDLPIKGILNQRYYQMSSEVDAYADAEYINQLIEKVSSEIDFPDQIILTANEDIKTILTNTGYADIFIQSVEKVLETNESCTISFEPIGVTTYFVETTDDVVLSKFISDFRQIDRNVSINNAVSSSEETSKLFLGKERFVTMYVAVIIFVIVILCFLYALLSRNEIKKERLVLRFMGLDNSEIRQYSFYSILMLWLMLLCVGGFILFVLYTLFIKYGVIVKGMGFEQAIIKSIFQFIGLTFFISLFQNASRLYYDTNR